MTIKPGHQAKAPKRTRPFLSTRDQARFGMVIMPGVFAALMAGLALSNAAQHVWWLMAVQIVVGAAHVWLLIRGLIFMERLRVAELLAGASGVRIGQIDIIRTEDVRGADGVEDGEVIAELRDIFQSPPKKPERPN